MNETRSDDRARSAGGGTRIQRSLLLAGTALFLVGIATLLGGVDGDILADGSQVTIDGGDPPANASTGSDGETTIDDGDAGSPTPSGGTTTDGDGTPTATPPGSDEPTGTPSPTGDDDSILDGILG